MDFFLNASKILLNLGNYCNIYVDTYFVLDYIFLCHVTVFKVRYIENSEFQALKLQSFSILDLVPIETIV